MANLHPVAYEHVAELGTKINTKSWARLLLDGEPPVAVLRRIQRSVDHYLTRRAEVMRDYAGH